MRTKPAINERLSREEQVTKIFLEHPNEESYADLFTVFTPQLVSFFRARRCEPASAEDLAQEVMLIVHRKVEQLRDGSSFRAWLFRIARNILYQHYDKQAREVETVDLADVADRLIAAGPSPAGTPAFEFLHWIALLDSRERNAMTLRFIEKWEYHEIAAAQAIPIGTVQWRVFNAKKKLTPYLTARQNRTDRAA